MLDATLKAQLASYLEYLERPVRISASLGEDPVSEEARALLADLTAASPRIEVVLAADAGRKPCLAIHLPGEEPRVRFAGLPLGHEFSSLVLALLHVSGRRRPGDPGDVGERRLRLALVVEDAGALAHTGLSKSRSFSSWWCSRWPSFSRFAAR